MWENELAELRTQTFDKCCHHCTIFQAERLGGGIPFRQRFCLVAQPRCIGVNGLGGVLYTGHQILQAG